MRDVLLMLALLTLMGCASSSANLQRESARVLGVQMRPEHVTIEDISRRMTQVSWTAIVRDRRYACQSDDMLRRPFCVESDQ